MRYVVLMAVVVLFGCEDGPVEPRQAGPYEVTTLRTLEEGTEADFGDLNENGQALWNESQQAILWDNGEVLEIPVGRFLGSSGEVLGWSSLWRDGELIELPGLTEGITEDGTIYLSRNDTLFTWRDGTLIATDRPVGYVGPEGRIWINRVNPNDHPQEMYDDIECGFYQNGEWHQILVAGACLPIIAEERGWVVLRWAGGINPGRYVFGPLGSYSIGARRNVLQPAPIVHVNSNGLSVSSDGFLGSNEDTTDLWEHFDSIRPGAINDDGEILAQLDNEIVLLTPR